MKLKERIFHAILFEVGAVLVSTVLVILFSDTGSGTALGVGIVMAIMAMVWNFIFNYIFDKFFTASRTTRSFGLRLFHTVAFEAGLLIATIPMIAYLLELTLWQAFLADVALTVAITIYAFVFNWAYDHLREKWLKNS